MKQTKLKGVYIKYVQMINPNSFTISVDMLGGKQLSAHRHANTHVSQIII